MIGPFFLLLFFFSFVGGRGGREGDIFRFANQDLFLAPPVSVNVTSLEKRPIVWQLASVSIDVHRFESFFFLSLVHRYIR